MLEFLKRYRVIGSVIVAVMFLISVNGPLARAACWQGEQIARDGTCLQNGQPTDRKAGSGIKPPPPEKPLFRLGPHGPTGMHYEGPPGCEMELRLNPRTGACEQQLESTGEWVRTGLSAATCNACTLVYDK
jgi:hypothetical protein